MPIEFSCPTCRQLVRTPDGTGGKKGKCPQCGAVVQIPVMAASGRVTSGSSATPPVPAAATPTAPMQASRPASATIDFHCTACGQLVRAPAAMAGKKGKCLQCNAVVQIPRQSQGTESKASSKTPMASADTVEELQPLTPIGGALGPLPPFLSVPASRPPSSTSGIKPVAGLTPIVPDPLLGLPTPVSDDALASLSRAVVSSIPFAEPVDQYTAPQPKPRRVVDDMYRRGLPWEQSPSMDAFGDTILMVVSAPHEAFSRMRRFGGIGNPMGFLVACHVLGQFLLWLEGAVLGVGWLFLYRGGANWEMFLIGHGLFGLGGLVEGVIRATIGGLMLAVFFHLALLVFGAAHGGFEATYRVIAFGCGSCYMLLPIPIVGPLFALVMQPLVLIYGVMYAHETGGWRALAAVFLPGILLLTCCAGIAVLVLIPAIVPLLRAAQ